MLLHYPVDPFVAGTRHKGLTGFAMKRPGAVVPVIIYLLSPSGRNRHNRRWWLVQIQNMAVIIV